MSVSLPPVDSYADALTALMPRGKGWPEARGPNWRALMLSLAPELRRMDAEAATVIEEADPRTAVDTIPDYERVLDLPDACLGEPEGIDDRRALVIALLLMKGGASPEYFEALGALFGQDVDVEEAFVPRAGVARVGDRLAPPVVDACAGVTTAGTRLAEIAAPFVWWTRSKATTAAHARAGEARVGARIATWGDPLLECLVARFRPAHTLAHHLYDADDMIAADLATGELP